MRGEMRNEPSLGGSFLASRAKECHRPVAAGRWLWTSLLRRPIQVGNLRSPSAKSLTRGAKMYLWRSSMVGPFT
jgi:hypothetical protein